MKRHYVSKDSTTTGQEKYFWPRKRHAKKHGKTLVFCIGAPASRQARPRKPYGLPEPLEILGESMVVCIQSWQRVTATQGGSQCTVRDHARIPLKTFEILMFCDGPQPKNSASLEKDPAPRAESYGLLKTLETLGN